VGLSKVVAKPLAKAGRKAISRAPHAAARTSFKRYAGAVGKMGRDVLHVAGPQGMRVRRVSDKILRGAAPKNAKQFSRLVKFHKVTRIVSLLDKTNPKEIGLIRLERKLAREMNVQIRFVSMPFGVDPPKASIARFLKTVSSKGPGKTFIHCRLGRDRTGTMVAIYRMAREGVGPRKALAEMKAFGYNPAREPFLAYLGKFVQKFGALLR